MTASRAKIVIFSPQNHLDLEPSRSVKKPIDFYTQAFYIDWAIFQNCPINVKIYATFFFALENYPINVKCLHIGYVQAFYLDWVVFKIYLGSFQYGNLPNQCKMLAHNLCASILH